MEGLSQVRRSKNKVSKTVWIVIFVTGWISTLTHSILVIEDYNEGRVTSRTGVFARDKLNFPAATFCYSNPIHCGNLHKRIEYCLKAKANDENCNELQLMSMCALFKDRDCSYSVSEAEKFIYGQLISNISICDHVSLASLSKNLLVEDDPYVLLTKDNRIKLAHQPQDMFKRCSNSRFRGNLRHPICKNLFNGTVTLTSTWIVKKHYVCYSFNFNHTLLNKDLEFEPMMANFMGVEDEVSFFINTEAFYHGSKEMVNSVYVIAHEANEIPSMIVSPKYALKPGQMAEMRVQNFIYKRASAPLITNCTSSWGELSQMVLPGISYQMRICLNMCLSKRMLEKCNCTFVNDFASIEERPLCNTTAGSQQSECIDDIMKSPPNCDICQPQCYESAYSVSVTAGIWPSDRSVSTEFRRMKVALVLEVMYKNMTHESSDKFSTEDWSKIRRHFDDNFLRLKLYFKGSNVEETEEHEEVTRTQVLSKIGGIFLLYMAISLVVLIEIVETFLSGIAWALNQKKNQVHQININAFESKF